MFSSPGGTGSRRWERRRSLTSDPEPSVRNTGTVEGRLGHWGWRCLSWLGHGVCGCLGGTSLQLELYPGKCRW